MLALVLYALTTKWGMGHFAHRPRRAPSKFTTVLTVLWALIMLASLVPMFMIELSLGIALRTGFDLNERQRRGRRVLPRPRDRLVGSDDRARGVVPDGDLQGREGAQRPAGRQLLQDVVAGRVDASASSRRRHEPIKVLLFFPEANEVKDQVRGYFDALASAAGHMTIEEHDRFVDAELAGKYKVTKDGVIVLVQRHRRQGEVADASMSTPTSRRRARAPASCATSTARSTRCCMKLVREKRKAYVMTGHGEITDPDSMPPELKGRVPERRTTVFKKRLGELNYEVKDLGLIDLAKDVPDDATIVIMLAPTVPLQPAEWAALDALPRQGRPPADRARPEGGSDARRARGQARSASTTRRR